MTELTMNYVVNPLAGFWKSFIRFTEVVGYSRAAAELARMGLYKESKHCMMQIKNIRASK